MLSMRCIDLFRSSSNRSFISLPPTWLNLEQLIHCQKNTSSCGTCDLVGLTFAWPAGGWRAGCSRTIMRREITDKSSCDDASTSSGTLASFACPVSSVWVCVCICACAFVCQPNYPWYLWCFALLWRLEGFTSRVQNFGVISLPLLHTRNVGICGILQPSNHVLIPDPMNYVSRSGWVHRGTESLL